MKLAKHDLLAALRLRYDHYSAGSIFELAIARAGLPDQDAYDVAQLAQLRAALAKVGDRLANVEARLDALLEAGGVTAPAAPAAPAEARTVSKADAPKAEVPTTAAPPGDAAKADKRDVVETTIALAGVDVTDGEQILVCGGFDALGDWNPDKAPTMKRDGDTWLATVRVPPGTEVPFKFLRRAADGTVTWESGDDRQLVAKPRIDATWR